MKLRRLVAVLLVIILVSFGLSLTLKANIGVGAWDGLTNTLSNLTNIKIGTMGMILNSTLILVQFILLGRDFKINHVLQIALVFVLGYTINFVYYDLLKNVNVINYTMKVMFLLTGYIINALSVSIFMLVNVVTFPLEGVCDALSKRTNIQFHTLRQRADILFIILVLVLSLLFKTTITIREGTVIGMIIFGPLIGVIMKTLEPLFVKYDLSD